MTSYSAVTTGARCIAGVSAASDTKPRGSDWRIFYHTREGMGQRLNVYGRDHLLNFVGKSRVTPRTNQRCLAKAGAYSVDLISIAVRAKVENTRKHRGIGSDQIPYHGYHPRAPIGIFGLKLPRIGKELREGSGRKLLP
jgi:hypothetical protein